MIIQLLDFFFQLVIHLSYIPLLFTIYIHHFSQLISMPIDILKLSVFLYFYLFKFVDYILNILLFSSLLLELFCFFPNRCDLLVRFPVQVSFNFL